MDDKKLRIFALSLLFLTIALNGLARTLQISDTMKTALTIASVASSLCAIALIFKAAGPRRQRVVLGLVSAAVLTACVAAAVFMHH